MSELEKMLSGDIYDPSDEVLTMLRAEAREITARYNVTPRRDLAARTKLLAQLLGGIGGEIKIEPHFNCDYGQHIFVGNNFYMNFGCVILDCAEVRIGDNCFIGPQVGIYTACHPLDPIERNKGIEFAKPITIGDSCWIGGHATINPGVRLGDNVVVGSGAVVTKNFPDNVVVAGNPARVIKALTT
ncbi:MULTISPECIES: sugar O-acetyltransferase [Corallincola]|uniref:Acetyltransferase n=2 Tax=Corallincola TaxID=1775176 RepID=A0A368NMV0_9GAMM|nr:MULTISPECIES: sugar O-acetyltransferase [Corallincola]RCU51476.1 sugar O-acetyltransferase [Corallincola holothuriorum]